MASDKGNHAKSQQQDVGFLEEGLEAFPEEQRKVLSRMMISYAVGGVIAGAFGGVWIRKIQGA